MNDNTKISGFQKNALETLTFSLSQFKGRSYLDVRLWQADDNGDQFATRKGITIAVNLFPKFKAAMGQVETFLVEQCLIDPEDLEALEVG